MKKKLKAVLFDMDGVLFDSMPYHSEAWHKVMKSHGLTLSREEAYMHEGRTGASTINIVFQRELGREAILDENSIEIRFLENIDDQVTLQVKDQQGNIMFQDVIIPPNEQETYKIDLTGYKTGYYELLYIERDMTFIGEFEIEHSIP